MKILQLIQKPQNRGAEIFASQLSNHLRSLGHEVKLVALFHDNGILPYKGEIIELEGSWKKRIFDFGAWKRLSNLIKEFQPDVVQCNAGDTLKYAVFSKIFYRWKQPIIVRNASEVGRYLKSWSHKIFQNFIYRKVDKVISVSKASQKDITNHFPFLGGKTVVIPVGLEDFEQISEIELLPSERKHIVHIGGFSFEKNHKGLLNIFQKVLEQMPKTHLHLIGDGKLKKKIMEEVRSRNLTSKIKFYGFEKNPLPYIKAADVLVLPSVIEGLPAVILESMYCDTPVIANNVGGVTEIVNPRTGVLIDCGDEKAFADAIVQVLQKPDMNVIDRAHKMVMDNFLNKKIVLDFEKTYQKMLVQIK